MIQIKRWLLTSPRRKTASELGRGQASGFVGSGTQSKRLNCLLRGAGGKCELLRDGSDKNGKSWHVPERRPILTTTIYEDDSQDDKYLRFHSKGRDLSSRSWAFGESSSPTKDRSTRGRHWIGITCCYTRCVLGHRRHFTRQHDYDMTNVLMQRLLSVRRFLVPSFYAVNTDATRSTRCFGSINTIHLTSLVGMS